MSNRDAISCLLLLGVWVAGCSHAPPTLTPAQVQRGERLRANADQTVALLQSGELRAGQSLDEFLARCTPYRIDFVDRYAFIEFYPVPAYGGLTLVAVDGKLASATWWPFLVRHEYFNAMSEAERQAASAAYETRLSADRP